MKRALAMTSALALASCAVGPNYVKPQPAPAAAAAFTSAAAPVFDPSKPEGAWWRLFNDPALDALIAQAFAANTDLRVAAANLERARALLSEERAGRLPSTDVNASATRRRVNGASSSGSGGGASVRGARTLNFYSAGIDLNYEVDLFGRVSRSIEAARADRDQQAALLDDVRVTVAAETARAYADACAAARQLAVARETVAIQQRTFALTETRYQIGSGSPLDVARGRTLVEQSRANVPAFEAARTAALYRLAVLTGQPPATPLPVAAACMAAPEVTTPIPVGDGAALLARRPDVRAAERALAAATARIGVATASLYPSISLGGSAGTSALRFGDLGKSDSFTFSIGPLISWSFPNIAVARARIRQAKASTQAQLATFDGAVLEALRDTETALDAYARELDRRASLRRALADAREASRIVTLRYNAGSQSQLDVLDAERTRAQAEAQLAASDAQVVTDQIALFKALGGGWETAAATPTN